MCGDKSVERENGIEKVEDKSDSNVAKKYVSFSIFWCMISFYFIPMLWRLKNPEK